MALTSAFYDGVATEADRAQNIAGNPAYGVGGPDDFRVTAHPTIPYAVLVKAGKAHGRKLTDTAATDQVVQCTAPAAGVVRWDCIVVRRNWQPILGGPSVLTPVSAGTTPRIPTTLNKNPGVLDDQPIFLVKWVGGTSAPTQFIDLRCWNAMGGAVIVHELAKDYLGVPGALVVLDRIPFQYLPVNNGLWDWVDVGGTSGSTANSVMRRDTANATSVGRMLLTSSQSSDARAATRKDYVDAQVAKLVTQSANGAMSANDKKKLDASTAGATGGTLVERNSSGQIAIGAPTSSSHASTKAYVDAAESSAKSYAAALGTSNYNANTIARRDGSGRLRVANPSDVTDAANKGVMDAGDSASRSYAAAAAASALLSAKTHTDGLTPRKFATGTATMTFAAGSFFGAVNVNLPAGFVATPKFMLQITSNLGWPALQFSNPMAVSGTKDSFQIRMGTVDGQPTGVTFNIVFDWYAILA